MPSRSNALPKWLTASADAARSLARRPAWYQYSTAFSQSPALGAVARHKLWLVEKPPQANHDHIDRDDVV
jgi:hypothetical protein